MARTVTERTNYAMKAYKHVLDEFLDDTTGNIDSALGNDGYKDDIRKVTKLTDSYLDQLMHQETGGPDKKLLPMNRGSRSILRCLSAFNICQKNDGFDIDSKWCEIPGEDFDDFRLDIWDQTIPISLTPHHQSLATVQQALANLLKRYQSTQRLNYLSGCLRRILASSLYCKILFSGTTGIVNL